MRQPLLLTLVLALLLSPIAQAEEVKEEDTRWYDVEVLLFVQKSERYRDSEQWPLDYTLPDMEDARTLQPPSTASNEVVPFTLLADDALRLRADAARIRKAPDLELLMHFGWRQPGLSEEESVAVRVDSQMLEASDAPKNQTADNGGEPPRLEGTLRLILSRYLHVRTDLLYREALEESAPPAPAPVDVSDAQALQTEPAFKDDLFLLAQEQEHYQVYRMQESRRMRSEELHYLDHPVFGLAVEVFPYEPPKEETEADSTPPQEGG